MEELGVATERVSVVGRLPDVTQATNCFVITPVVGVLAAETRLTIASEEIVGVFAVPLELIVAAGAIYEDSERSRARRKPMYAFDYGDRHIWGFTARVLKSFVDAWTAPASALCNAVENAWR
jgi:hypothetical protein